MQQISGMDEFFLHFEHAGCPMHIGCISIYEPSNAETGSPDYPEIREAIGRGVLRWPLLRKKLLTVPLHLDRPYWVDATSFDLDDHVRPVALSGPRTWDGFCEEMGRIFEQPLDFSRPLWESLVIRDLEGIEGMPPGGFAVVTKVHHVMIDGVGGTEVLRAFLDASPESETPSREKEWRPVSAPSPAGLVVRAWANQLTRLVDTGELAARSLSGLVRSQLASAAEDAEPTGEASPALPVPRMALNGQVSSSRVFGGVRLELDELQAIRRAVVGATINDVILAICGGALRRYLNHTGELPSDSVVAMAPISIRGSSGDEAERADGNRVSMMAVALRTDIEDPLERLIAVRGLARSSKQRSSDVGSTTFVDAADVVPSVLGELLAHAYHGLGLASYIAPYFNCIVTNVRGPEESLYLAGARMQTTYGVGPTVDGAGLLHGVLSYAGSITLSFNSCPEMLSEPGLYSRCLQQAFEELQATVPERMGA
jgi:WS/DGAT/MGAT family acyltransferase